MDHFKCVAMIAPGKSLRGFLFEHGSENMSIKFLIDIDLEN